MDCPSCGAIGQTKARCEACGFTFPSTVSADAGDDALSLVLGLVCTSCDAYNDPGTAVCASCGASLDAVEDVSGPVAAAAMEPFAVSPLAVASAMTAPPSWMTPPTGNTLSTQFAMKKVDLASISGGGLAAPVEEPPSTSLPPSTALPPLPSTPPQAPLSQPPSTTQPPSTPSPSPSPSPSTPSSPTQTCWRCNTDLELHDKFCRNCGARTDGGPGGTGTTPSSSSSSSSSPAATQVLPAMKLNLPNLPGLSVAAGATQVLPAFRVAQATAAPSTPQPSATMFFGAATAERVAKLILVRGHSQFGNQWRMQAGETVIGRSRGMVLFPDDLALAHEHARLVFRGADLFLEPAPTQNGVYVRIREPARLVAGDEFVVGAQRLRLQLPEERAQLVTATSDAHETRLLGSMVKPQTPIVLQRIAADPRFHEVFHRAQRLLTIGRAHCDINFASDGFVSERHAQLTQEGSHVLLEDLRSRNGTYVRVHTATKLSHGDLLLMGDQVLRVELPR